MNITFTEMDHSENTKTAIEYAQHLTGVGKNIQLLLANICRENNKTAVSGCWYYNTLSKKTIESSGRYTKARLLKVTFEVE